VPLSAAQLEFLLARPRQLEAELGFPISRPVSSPPVVRHAIRLKQQRLISSRDEAFPWHTYWLMVIKADKFGVGLIGFKGIPDEHGEVEIGYGIDPNYRRKGYMTEAAGTLIDWALEQTTCLAVMAWSDKDNQASSRVLEKVGMKKARETADQFCWVRG
jgi:RimJ/RimL family protein N-acetyltransferase